MIGIVAFSGSANLVLPPTNDQQALQTAIASLTTGRRTAIGSGILQSLDAIAKVDDTVAATASNPSSGVAPTPVPKGAYAPDIIVLLSDGDSDVGIPPLDAAQQAAVRGVRVYTIGYASTNESSGSGSGNSFGGGFSEGVDEAPMKQIAAITGAKYYAAANASELLNVFQNLPTSLITKYETMEISVKHLNVLKDAGLVTVYQHGREKR